MAVFKNAKIATVVSKPKIFIKFFVRSVSHDRNAGKPPKGTLAREWTNLPSSRSTAAILRHIKGFDCNGLNTLGWWGPRVYSFLSKDVKYFVNFLGCPAAEWTTSSKWSHESWVYRVLQPNNGFSRPQWPTAYSHRCIPSLGTTCIMFLEH